MSDNPFAEPDDDRTVIRPVPGGRRRPPTPPPPPTPAATPVPAVDPSAAPAISVSPLTVAASPLLQLLARLRAMRRAPDPGVLRERVVQDLRAFERQARDAGIAMELLRPAHYALCASIDDVVLNTPWGAASGWASQTLVGTFHPGARGTDQFFDQLRQMRRNSEPVPAGHRADVRLPLARLHGSLPAGARRGRTRADAVRHARRDRRSARGRGSRAVATLARRRRAVSVRAAALAGLGRAGRRGGAVRRPVVLDLHQPECGLRRSAGPGAHHTADAHAAGDARRDRAAAATAAGSGRTDRARSAARQPPAGHRQSCGHPAGHRRDTDRPDRRPLDVRTRKRGRSVRVAAAAGANRRRPEKRKRIAAGDRLHRQSAGPHRALSVELPALRRACQRGARHHRARSWRLRHGSVRRAAPMPTRSPPTPPPKVANRTGGSRSCCIARTDSQ